jgi:NAD(P)-dependent dehydrogenase (short-subunit alcohol dehydrogenase family)
LVTDIVQKTSETFGSFHGIFHAAGVSMVRPVKLSKSKQFDDVYASCVKPAIALARAASLRGVMVDGGTVVMMSSVAAVRGQAGMALYSSAKAAIEGMVKSLAVEFAPRGIRVNAICRRCCANRNAFTANRKYGIGLS